MMKRLIHMPILALTLALSPVLAATASSSSTPASMAEGLTVVELFTSQGCNSCPAADALAEELATRPGILLLSWNVDYWDYLGWKDTMARPEHTARQRAYNKALGRGNRVFTPQMVINGRDQAVGSSKLDVETAVADGASGAKIVPVRYEGDKVILSLPKMDNVADAKVSVVHYEFEKVVPIGAGENGGRALTYTNPVFGSDIIATWNGEAKDIAIDKDKLSDKGNAILVQEGDAGPILMAAVVDMP